MYLPYLMWSSAIVAIFNLYCCIEILYIVPLCSNLFVMVLAFVYSFVISSTIEWFVHKYVYHVPFPALLTHIYKIHNHIHHKMMFPTSSYVTTGPPNRISMDGDMILHNKYDNIIIQLKHFGFYMIFGVIIIMVGAFATHSSLFVSCTVFWALVFSDLFIRVHDTIHRPGAHKWVESQSWFDFIDTHHWLHHIDTTCNLNFLLPLFDLQVGTIRFKTTPAEDKIHGTLREAKIVKKIN